MPGFFGGSIFARAGGPTGSYGPRPQQGPPQAAPNAGGQAAFQQLLGAIPQGAFARPEAQQWLQQFMGGPAQGPNTGFPLNPGGIQPVGFGGGPGTPGGGIQQWPGYLAPGANNLPPGFLGIMGGPGFDAQAGTPGAMPFQPMPFEGYGPNPMGGYKGTPPIFNPNQLPNGGNVGQFNQFRGGRGMFGNLFAKAFGQLGLPGRTGGSMGMRGPDQSPFAGLRRFQGPFGNGGAGLMPAAGSIGGMNPAYRSV